MADGLRVHQFSGFTPDDVLNRIGGTEKYLEQYEAFESGPFKNSRTQGIIAAYLACNPGMTASGLAAFCYHNGIPLDYDINLDTDDTQEPRLLGGMINFLYDFPNLQGFQENFNNWAAGYEVAELPRLPDLAQPTIEEPEPFIPSQPAPQQPAQTLQPSQPLAPQPAPTSATNYAPAPQPAISNQPAPAPIPTAAAPSSQAMPKKTEPEIPWMMILIGAAIIFFLMNKKKGKR